MRQIFASLLIVTALASGAVAQTSTTTASPSNSAGSGNAAVNDKPADSPQTTGSVEPGSNSFTESQVRSRLEAQGFSNVVDLRKDDQGIWRGKANRGGQSIGVALDYKGTIQAQ